LINIGSRLNYDFSKHMTFGEASQTLTVLQWFAINPPTNDLETLVVETMNLHTTNSVMSQILSSPNHYDRDKISIMGHLAALGLRKNLSFPELYSDWDFIQHGRKHRARDVLFCILDEQSPNSCGMVAFAHFEKFIPIENNEIFEMVRELKCWDKSVRQKLKDIHDRLNWEAISKQLETSKGQLVKEIDLINQQLSEVNHFMTKTMQLNQQRTESENLVQQLKSEITNNENLHDQLHKGLKELRDPDQLPPFIRQRYQSLIGNHSAPSKILGLIRRKEGTQHQLQRRSELRDALIEQIELDLGKAIENLQKEKERLRKKTADICALTQEMTALSDDFVEKAGYEPGPNTLQELRESLVKKRSELEKIDKKLQRLSP